MTNSALTMPMKIWGQYRAGVDFKQMHKLYTIAKKNEQFYSSDQWSDIEAKNLPKPVYNFLEQIVDMKVSLTMSRDIVFKRKPDELSKDNQLVKMAADAFTAMDKTNWENNEMVRMNEGVILDAALTGIGITHWYWDSDIQTGNDFVTNGDFAGEVIDMVNFYVSNPNEPRVQEQDWIIISMRKSVSKLKKLAKASGVKEADLDMIKPDSNTNEEGFDKAQNEQDNVDADNRSATLLLKYWKDDDGKVHFSKSTQHVMIVEDQETLLTVYPVAVMPWKTKKRFIYGQSEIAYIIYNQMHVNKMEAMRQLNAMLMGMPKLLYDKAKVNGVTNQIGGVYPVNGGIKDAMTYVQPQAMSLDVDKSITSAITWTREFKGINDNFTGSARAENSLALQSQHRQSGIPLETIERNFKAYLADIAEIWLDFYRHYYDMERAYLDENEEKVLFVGAEYEDIYLKTDIDVSRNSQYTELASIELLTRLLDGGHISIVQFLERYPDEVIPKKQELIEELGGAGTLKQTFNYEMMARIVESMPPEQQAEIMNLPDEEKEEAIMRFALEADAIPVSYSAQPQAQSQQRASNSSPVQPQTQPTPPTMG